MGVLTRARILVVFLTFVASQTWAGGDPPDFVLQWGSLGSGDGQFQGMHGIEVDAEGNVYVPDTGNNRIQKCFPGDDFREEQLLADDPVLVHVKLCEVGVTLRQVEFDSGFHVGASRSDLCEGELEAVG